MERDRHLDRVIPFLNRTRPDVMCLQEVAEADFLDFKERFGCEGVFAPMSRTRSFREDRGFAMITRGVCILSRWPMVSPQVRYYFGDPEGEVPEFRRFSDTEIDQSTIKKPFVWATIARGSELFTIGTTHFTWTFNGAADDDQRRDSDALLAILDEIPHIVWCGDLNAPRGKSEIFAKFAARYHDNIPSRYMTSLCGSLHRAGPLELMVDVLFSTPRYAVLDVKFTGDVSDHYAITANVWRNAV